MKLVWRHGSCLALAVGVAFASVSAQAQEFPSRPIHLVVPSSPGGSTDMLARGLANEMQKQSGVTVVVENRPGASGAIGVQHVVRAAPDGYTIIMSVADAITTYPMYNPKVSYRLATDLTPVGQVVTTSSVYVVNSKSPWKTLPEFVEASKKEHLHYATQGGGSVNHLLMEALKKGTGARIEHVPYQGINPAMMSVLKEETAMVSSSVAGSKAQIADGKLRALATTRAERYASLPDVPTMKELGYPNLTLATWFGIFGPAGMPAETTEKLFKIIESAAKSPSFVTLAERLEVDVDPVGGAAFDAIIAKDTEFWGGLMREANIKMED